MNITERQRRRFKRLVCVIVFFLLGGIMGYQIPTRVQSQVVEGSSKIEIFSRQPLKILRLSELKINATRLPGTRPQYAVNLTMTMELDEAMLKSLFDQFQVGEGG
jgi:hypothetical protein